ncbi:hypothetical protein FB45DRAFT_904481 [Roridomyces roridus]|uniref:Transmembrane protein n=1 Tax=Roridomyces roridus TaxID=1738132 RepID=A0AAD7C6R2_9AGAR|nr:hypothetical protein FB45DRAFT_904481 [Roridomyces roridus]
MAIDKFTLFRIISFTLAAGDVFQTIPATFNLYKKQWVNGSLSPVCFFYAMARYMTIISLVSNGIGFFGTNFTPASCKRYYMLPNSTAFLAGVAVQFLVFIRTYAISGRSRRVYYLLGSVMLLLFPVQAFGIAYHRDPFLSNGSCKGKVLHPGEPDWNIVYYSAHMTFDLLACATATCFLVSAYRVSGQFSASKFVSRVLRTGLLYFVVVFLVNLWVVLEFAYVFSSGAASTLPLAVVLIAAQHLVLSTQRMMGDDSLIDDYYRSGSRNRNPKDSGPALFLHPSNAQDVELEAGAFAVTDNSRQPSTEGGRDGLLSTGQHKGDSADDGSIATSRAGGKGDLGVP